MIHARVRLASAVAAALLVSLTFGAPDAAAFDWTPFAAESVVEIRTHDEDGAVRDTKVWLVVLGDRAYVRTNDSRWLANIRRGSSISLDAGGGPLAVSAREVDDAATKAAVEEAYKTKYGFVQRVMSALRISEPTVLELSPAG